MHLKQNCLQMKHQNNFLAAEEMATGKLSAQWTITPDSKETDPSFWMILMSSRLEYCDTTFGRGEVVALFSSVSPVGQYGWILYI